MKLRYCFFLALFLIAGTSQAATHTINFGGTLGTAYDPNSLTNLAVGDEIVWMGDFSSHPLTLTDAPAGAQMFSHINTGSSFSYTIVVAGSYAYQCDFHFAPPTSMKGTFSTGSAGVDPSKKTSAQMEPIYPNPAAVEAMVHFTLEKAAHVTLRVFDATGKLVSLAADEQMGEGFHMLTIDTKQFASGSYQYVLQAGDAVLRREMIVVK